MKKAFLPLLILPLLLSCGGQSSGTPASSPSSGSEASSSESTIPNLEEVDELRVLLVKQDLSPFAERVFSTLFQQDFHMLTHDLDDEYKMYTNYYSYRGVGTWGCQYKVDQQTYDNIVASDDYSLFDFMIAGNGYYEIYQTGTSISYTYDSDNGINDELQKYELYQQLTAFFTDDDFRLYNKMSYTEALQEDVWSSQYINGRISRDLLFDATSPQALERILLSTNLYGLQDDSLFLDNLYYDVCRDLLTKNDKEISEFITTNHVSVDEGEEYTEVTFLLEDEELLSIIEEQDIIPGPIQGRLYYDKQTGEFIRFEYDIVVTENQADPKTGATKSVSMRITAYGFSGHKIQEGDPDDKPGCVVYEDGNQFVSEMAQQVIPASF